MAIVMMMVVVMAGQKMVYFALAEECCVEYKYSC